MQKDFDHIAMGHDEFGDEIDIKVTIMGRWRSLPQSRSNVGKKLCLIQMEQIVGVIIAIRHSSICLADSSTIDQDESNTDYVGIGIDTTGDWGKVDGISTWGESPSLNFL